MENLMMQLKARLDWYSYQSKEQPENLAIAGRVTELKAIIELMGCMNE